MVEDTNKENYINKAVKNKRNITQKDIPCIQKYKMLNKYEIKK